MDTSLNLNSHKVPEKDTKTETSGITARQESPQLFKVADETAGTIASAETSGSKLFNTSSETAGTIASAPTGSSSSSSSGGSISAMA